MANFIVSGPFIVPTTKLKNGRMIAKENINEFWLENKEFENAIGCYVFAFRAGKGIKPIYIGKATKGFKQEIFTEHKKNKYHEGFALQGKGTPVMYFVYLEKSQGKPNNRAIDEVETYLIQSAMVANPEILNDRKTAVSQWSVDGIVRSRPGKSGNASSSLKKCLNI